MALLVLTGIGVVVLDSRLNRIDAMPTHAVGSSSGTNWLFVGTDSRQGLSEEEQATLGTGGDIGTQRTDTMMLLHIPFGGDPVLVSLPRDLYVPIEGYGSDKLNAAYSYGGAPLLVDTIERQTQVHIDHYAEIGFGGFASVVDAIDGIELCPSEPVEDPLAQLSIPAGCQQMDGPTALGYVRTRATARGDLDRVERQREFLAALSGKAKSPGTLLNPFRSLPMSSAFSDALAVDKGTHVWSFPRMAWALSSAESITAPVGGFGSNESGSVLLWGENTAQFFDALSHGRNIPEELKQPLG